MCRGEFGVGPSGYPTGMRPLPAAFSHVGWQSGAGLLPTAGRSEGHYLDTVRHDRDVARRQPMGYNEPPDTPDRGQRFQPEQNGMYELEFPAPQLSSSDGRGPVLVHAL